ncbi:16568_t:CDS:2 [Funneliformis geosporum]|uniref:16568_t:CDS:1 n=1 Tax=Funneliformis geosporum TaxID=1117311 RepID=A0A9W4SYI8_9GLOM|nr:16568_t:CDS:2 [Funneliformis geosporum]
MHITALRHEKYLNHQPAHQRRRKFECSDSSPGIRTLRQQGILHY